MDLTQKIGEAINANNGRCPVIEEALVEALDAVVAIAAKDRSSAMHEAWLMLESQRQDVIESFRGADHATGERGANFAYMGYTMAMDKLREEARQARGQVRA